jgi:ribosomal protein L12E/L44/L45/RPP1/RPP2
MSLKDMSKAEHDEKVTTLAALLLIDAGAEVTADKIGEVITASGNSVDKYWPGLFASLLAKADVNAIITSSTAPGAVGGGGGGGGGAAPDAKKDDAKKDDKKGGDDKKGKEKEPKEEPVEVAGAGDLFGGGGGGGKY